MLSVGKTLKDARSDKDPMTKLTFPGSGKFYYWNEMTINNEFYKDHICAIEPDRTACSAMFEAIAAFPLISVDLVTYSAFSMAIPRTT